MIKDVNSDTPPSAYSDEVADQPVYGPNSTIATYFGDDASLSRLESITLSEMEEGEGEEEQADADNSLSETLDDESDDNESDADLESSSYVPSIVSHRGEPTVGDLDPPLLPPHFASIHQFTRPVKESLGSRFGKESRRKFTDQVRAAVEKELQSEYWV
jgi:hypothetical protein